MESNTCEFNISLCRRSEYFMQLKKKRIKKEDGRYLIYYTFTNTKEEKEVRDVRVKMEPHSEAMDNNSYSSTEQDL